MSDSSDIRPLRLELRNVENMINTLEHKKNHLIKATRLLSQADDILIESKIFACEQSAFNNISKDTARVVSDALANEARELIRDVNND